MDERRLRTLLGDRLRLEFKNETASTNDDAKSLAQAGSVPALIVANRQSGGRGRRGNSFASPEGGIYMSLVAPIDFGRPGITLLTSFAAQCVCEAIQEECGFFVGIKWVNDIYVDGRKLAGILVETVDAPFGRCAVVGVGINGLAAPDAGSEIKAACLTDFANDPDLEAVCADIAVRLRAGLLDGFDPKGTVEYCRERSVLLGRDISFEVGGELLRGVAVGLGEAGELIVDVDGRHRALSSATCNVRLAFAPSFAPR